MRTLNISIVKGTPRWGQRAFDLIYLNKMSAIVFMMDKDGLKRANDSNDDWRVALMVKIIEYSQEPDAEFVIPIVA